MTRVADIQAIVAALASGEHGVAERGCREALRGQPQDTDVLLLLAISLHRQTRLAEAVAVYARLAALCPDSGLHWGNYATALRELAAHQDAPEPALQSSLAAYATALRLAPDNVDTLVNYGLLLLQRHEFPHAREVLLRAHRLDPHSSRTGIHAARACSVCQDPRADELLKPWRLWTALDDSLQLELASVLVAVGEAAAAQVVLAQLLRRRPEYPPAQIQMAMLYERMNHVAEAEALLQRMLDAADGIDAATQAEMARLQATLALRQGEPELARAMLERLGPRDDADHAHYFTLAGVCDRLGDREATLQALQLAHARQVQNLRAVAPERFVPGAPILPSATTRVTAQQYAQWPSLRSPDARQSPVFIVGFPRSGTTLLEQMLDAHAQLQSMDERPFLNILADELAALDVRVPADLRRLGQRDCDELRARYWELVYAKVPRKGQAQIVDKNPLNMLWLPMIHRLFPQAKIILALRHPCDVIVSCYLQNFHSAVLALACSSLERLATSYVTAMEHWLQHVDVFQPDLLVSRYERLVTDFGPQTRRIGDFLGITDVAPLLRFHQHARDKSFIGTPSYSQVIHPLNRQGLDRWTRYRRELEPVLPILEPMLRRWNYMA